MFYKFSQVSSRIQSADAALGQGVSKAAAGEVNYIPAYKARSTGLFNMVNRIKLFQDFYKSKGGDAPIFLRSPQDVMVYRGIMAFSVFGIAVTFYSLYQMASGNMKKK